MRYFWFFVLLLSMSGCCHMETPPTEDPDWTPRHRVLQERPTDDLTFAVESYAATLKYDHRLHLDNAFACIGDHGTTIHLDFHTQHILELCEVRMLLVDVVEGLLFKLNSDYIPPEQRPFPFTADMLEITIDFESFYVKFNDQMYIGWVVLEDGIAFYYQSNLRNEKLDCWKSHFEPYYKSRTIAMAQRQAEKDYQMSHPHAPSALKEDLYRAPPPPLFR